jgi:hypothetical protein
MDMLCQEVRSRQTKIIVMAGHVLHICYLSMKIKNSSKYVAVPIILKLWCST